MNKLDPEFKEKLLAALRSGQYKQGKQALCKTDETGDKCYCCLGVAYLIAKGVDPPDTDSGYISGTAGISSKAKPIDVDGVPAMLVGAARDSSVVKTLTEMNDDGKTFEYIADYIDRNL